MAITRDDFPLPDLDEPLTAPFFAAAARGELAIPRCGACSRFVWYPAAACAACGSDDLAWVTCRGRGTLFSWAVVRRPFLPAFADKVPFVSALIALEEDPAVRVVGYVVDCEPESLAADLPVQAVFRPLEFSTVPGRSVTVPMWKVATRDSRA